MHNKINMANYLKIIRLDVLKNHLKTRFMFFNGLNVQPFENLCFTKVLVVSKKTQN